MSEYYYCDICGKEVYYENCVIINSYADDKILHIHKGCMVTIGDWTNIIELLRKGDK